MESSVGAHLANAQARGECRVWYWRAGDLEVDFVVETARKSLTAIEVKSGTASPIHKGMEAFERAYHPTRKLLLGEGGILIEDFLSRPVRHWIEE